MPYSFRFIKHLITTFVVLISAVMPALGEDTYFPYPQAPDEMQNLTQRSNYIVDRFWERCNFSNAFLSRDKMKQAFTDYINIIPYATTDTVEISIDNLIGKVRKQPKDLLTLAQIAQETMYGPDAEFWSDDLYLPFVRAVVANKKIPKADKAPFRKQLKVLENCQTGIPAPGIDLTLRDGTKFNTDSLKAPLTILFVNSPDCTDCMMDRVKLAANVSAIRHIDDGKLQIVVIGTVPYSTEWAESMSAVPQTWVAGTNPDIDTILDIRIKPEIYILGSNHKILVKHATMDNIIPMLESIP